MIMNAARLIRGMVMPQYPMSQWAFNQVRKDPYVIHTDLGKDFTYESFAEMFVGFARGMEGVADDAYCTTPLPRDHPCETELNGIVAREIVDMRIACYRRGSCSKG